MNKLLAIALFLFAINPCTAQKPLSDVGTRTCDTPGDNTGEWVRSAAGTFAAVELKAVVTGTGDTRHCVTTWTLHVKTADQTTRSFDIDQRDDTPKNNEWVDENSFAIKSWSKDGSLLLASEIQTQGDWDKTTPVIFDFKAGDYSRVELLPLFKPFLPAGCYVVYRPVGFADDDSVLIDPISVDDDSGDDSMPCFPNGRWKMDFRKGTVARLQTNVDAR